MKKLIITSILALVISPVFASDSLPQEVTSEVYTNTEIVEENYQVPKQVNYRPYTSTYCQYTDDRGYCNKPAPRYEYNLKPITVYTGKTVTVQKHYDVYQPKVIYQKVNSYTTTKTCEYCN